MAGLDTGRGAADLYRKEDRSDASCVLTGQLLAPVLYMLNGKYAVLA